jgi:predicted acetyltransferase
MDYREVASDDPAFARLVRQSFDPTSGPFDLEEFDPDEGPDTVGARRGLFDGDDLVATCKHYWFDVDLRGRSVGAPGLSVVASPPEHRRGGNVRRLLEASLDEYRERGDPLSVLWPFSTPFYGQYGWATANRAAEYEVDPDDLAFATDAVATDDVEWRQVTPDDPTAVDAVDAIDAETWTGALALDRSEGFWRNRVFQSWKTDPFVYLAERGDDPVAFAVYYVNEDDGRRLDVRHHGAVDHDALLALLAFCHHHDSQVDTVRFYAPVDWGVEHVLADPGAVETTVYSGPMARLVDVAVALETVPYPGVDADFVLDVDDPLTDWHDDPLRLAVAGDAASCERTPDATPDVELGVGDLTQLVVGTRSARELARTRDLDADDHVVETLAACFPPTNPGLLQRF